MRSVAFDRRVARLLRKDDLAVIATSNAALATLRAASELGVPGLLDYPTAHHAWVERLLSERQSSTRGSRTRSSSAVSQRGPAGGWRTRSGRRTAFSS